MKKNIGLWIDNREAVIVVNADKDEQFTRITSGVEKKNRFPGGSRKDGLQTTESISGNKLEMKLSSYFDDIIAYIRDADLIYIFGPGETKKKLVKYLEREGLKERIVKIETMDNMTDNQIVAKVRECIQAKDIVMSDNYI